MTHLDGADDDQAEGPDNGPEAVALDIAGAVESLTNVWAVAAQDPALRLSPHQLKALRVLKATPGLNLTALADHLDIGMPTASRLCDRLEAAGLLERGYHPLSRREVQLRLTSPGGRVLTEAAQRRAQALTVVLRVMEPVERVALRRGLKAFSEAQEAASSRSEHPDRR
ncbi:MarR family transcriptional regulator [Streptomyces sp. NBC_00015]|uniref:MarR family winged helix-turn-helix transcriptional regulator n=1 Tax=unclassified Streptomyces TaxID=2593676 RepID=UPI002256EB1D|nr:MarR family transcriptional regulator [Streptomyces sp. NBC_00103]MCX5372657.1 MarR family transcriptional regulator [Streptomyces sp. NBC_00103]